MALWLPETTGHRWSCHSWAHHALFPHEDTVLRQSLLLIFKNLADIGIISFNSLSTSTFIEQGTADRDVKQFVRWSQDTDQEVMPHCVTP